VQEAVLGRLRGRKTNPGRLMIEAIRTTEHALTGSHRYRDTLGNPRIRTWRLGLRPHHLSLEAPGATQEDETAESFTALDSSIARWKEKELREMVREAVSKLDIIYRRIFEDRLNGYTAEEIAKRHHLSVATVWSYFTWGKERLRPILARALGL